MMEIGTGTTAGDTAGLIDTAASNHMMTAEPRPSTHHVVNKQKLQCAYKKSAPRKGGEARCIVRPSCSTPYQPPVSDLDGSATDACPPLSAGRARNGTNYIRHNSERRYL